MILRVLALFCAPDPKNAFPLDPFSLGFLPFPACGEVAEWLKALPC